MRRHYCYLQRLLLAGMLLVALGLSAQNDYTKSGTLVSPAPRTKALPPSPSKHSFSPLPDPTAGTFLIVSRPDLVPALTPLMQWKKQQGYRVELLVLNTNSRDSIRLALKHRYEASTPLNPPQRYVLLVGDVDRLQGGNGRYTPTGLSTHTTDLYYGEYTNDYLPEAFCGRLSVADSGQLAIVTDKIIQYEKGLFAPARQILLAAGNESRSNALTTTNGQVNYLAQSFSRFRPEMDTVCFRNPQPEGTLPDILEALASPNALVNYTAHCTTEGWNNPVVSAAMIDSLHNAVPTVFVNNCCRSNAFNSDCFGERLLRMPSGGAAAVIGATNESFWDEDFYYAVGAKYPVSLQPQYDSTRPGAFDPLWVPDCYDPDKVSLGALNYAGCSAVTRSGSPYDAFYWEIYCILGDPSMIPFMGTADTLQLAANDSVLAGSTSLAVYASPFTRIAATQHNELLGTTVTDSLGFGVIHFCHGLMGDSLLLTANRPGAICRQISLAILTPDKGTLALQSAVLDSLSDSLTITVTNVGRAAAVHHAVTLVQTPQEAANGVQLNHANYLIIDSLTPHADTSISLYIGDCHLGQHPMLLAHLEFVRDTLVYCTQALSLDFPDRRPQLIRWSISDHLGNPATQLLPGNRYLAEASFNLPPDSAQWFLDGMPMNTEYDAPPYSLDWLWPEDAEPHELLLTAYKDHWQSTFGGWLIPYRAVATFERHPDAGYPWQMDADHPWQPDSAQSHGGSACLRSASIGNAQRSSIALDIETLVDDSIVFYYKVSSQGSDWLYFYVDGQRRGYWSGDSGWRRYARFLAAGSHHLEWIYQKDASGQERDDCARIDDILFPLAFWPTKCGESFADTSQPADIPMAENMLHGFNIFPNPATTQATITFSPSHLSSCISVYNAVGEIVDNIFLPANCSRIQYSTTHLRFGIYTFVLKSAHGTSSRKLSVIK